MSSQQVRTIYGCDKELSGILTSESELRRGLDLPDPPGHEALVHAVVLALQVEDLQRLAVDVDPAPAPAQGHPVLLPCDGGPVPLLSEALHVRLPPNVNNLLRRDQI